MKQKNTIESNCITSYTQCIQWNLGDIPSLGIKNGDYLDTLVYAIANKICECCGDTDLSTLSLQCIYDKILIEEPPIPAAPTLLQILQLLINSNCRLRDLIQAIQDQIDDINNDNLVLDLKCLAKVDGFGNPLPYDLKSVLQDLITEVCKLRDEVDLLNLTVVDLQNQINNLVIVPYVLPTVTTCISPSRRLDLSSGDIATSLCNLRNVTGTEVQIQSAISQQCSNFNSEFGSITGWILSPSNLAQSYSNLELAFCDVLTRLIAMEQTCCAPLCENIKIGFIHSYDNDLHELTLSFTSGAGTSIPSGFIDCGSEFTIKGCDGTVILTSVQPISNDADLIFVLPLGICINTLTISIKTKFCLSDNEVVILTCRDCYSKEIEIQDVCCTLTNNGGSDVILVYETPII